jgi:hypothetical protein
VNRVSGRAKLSGVDTDVTYAVVTSVSKSRSIWGMATLIAEKSLASTKTATHRPYRKPGAAVDRFHPSVTARSLSSETSRTPTSGCKRQAASVASIEPSSGRRGVRSDAAAPPCWGTLSSSTAASRRRLQRGQ